MYIYDTLKKKLLYTIIFMINVITCPSAVPNKKNVP